MKLSFCYKCYSYEHLYKEWPKDQNFKICSECSSYDHTYRERKDNTKKCVTCNQQHRTLAAKCPVRKDLRKKQCKKTERTDMQHPLQTTVQEAALQ